MSSTTIGIALGLALALAALVAVPAAGQVPREAAAIVKGVDELKASGTPGGVTCFGPTAWPLVVGGDVPVAALGELDRGRVLAMTHGGYLEAGCLEDANTARFVGNAVRWLSGGKKKPSVAQLGGDAGAFADALGLKLAEDWTSADVLLIGTGGLKPGRLEAVRAYLAAGGRALVAATPWGWQQLTPNLGLARDLTLNRLLEPFGLAFDHRTASRTTDGGFRVVDLDTLPAALHAERVFRALEAGQAGDAEARRLGLATLGAAVGALSDFEPSLMVPLRRAAELKPAGELQQQLGKMLASEADRRELMPLGVRWGGWQLAGPFGAGPLGRTGKELGGPLKIEDELKLCALDGPGPELDKEWKGRAGKQAWSPVELDKWGRELNVGDLDLIDLVGVRLDAEDREKDWSRGVAVFLYRRLELDAPASFALTVAGDGGLGAWVDGELAGVSFAGGGSAHLELGLDLAPGVHHLWIRSVHVDGVWRLRMAGEEGFDTSRVDAAVDLGMGWLAGRQLIDGSWSGDEGYGPGYTAMVLFALSRSGLAADHPVIRRGMAYLAANPAHHVYSLSAVMLARAALDPAAGPDLVAGVAQLAEWQTPTGMWAYPVHPSGGLLDDDLSNTLFVALAYDAAAARGVEIPAETWRDMIDGTLSTQENERAGATGKGPLGFAYRPHGDITGSMTVAGLSTLLFAKKGLGSALTKREAARIDDALERGLAWLDRHMVWDENPGQGNWLYFWIYGIERLGSLLGTSTLGGIDWYRQGAEHLIEVQNKSGEWTGGHPGIDTVLALLFLKRATAPSSGAASARDWRLVGSVARPTEENPPHELLIQARCAALVGEPLDCWLQGAGDGPAVLSVEWLARTPAGDQLLAKVGADEDRKLGRFAARIGTPPTAAFELVAVAELEGGGSLASDPVKIPALFSRQELDFAFASAANLLRGASASASSARGGSRASDAIDGQCGSNWIHEPSDRDPVWSAELASAVSASRLILVHRGPSREYSGLSHVMRVKVTLNRRFEFELMLDPDEMRLTTLEFGRSLKVSRVDVAVLKLDGNEGASGFSELVLLP